MKGLGSHPAIYAGLLGGAAWSVPTRALAEPVARSIETGGASLALKLAAGCGVGAVSVILCAYIIDRRARAAEDADPDIDYYWASSSLNLLHDQEVLADDDPTGDLGRYRTGRVTIEPSLLVEQPATTAGRRPRHSAHLASAHVVAKASASRAGRHFSDSSAQEVHAKFTVIPGQVASEPKGRHFAARAAEPEVEQSAERLQMEEKEQQLPLPETDVNEIPAELENRPLTGRERLMNLPAIQSRYDMVRSLPLGGIQQDWREPQPVYGVQDAPAPAREERSKLEGQPAGITGRIKLRVREVLAERLESDVLDGVPIITRADGSVGDVRPTWFDQAVIPKLASITGVVNKLEDTASFASPSAGQTNGPDSVAIVDTKERASYISRRVAEVNEGMFPERRSVDELERGDIWEQALEAMGEHIAQSTPIFQDMIGGPATIDDPDGLEGSTAFIPFRVPAAHPEVVDTNTYVDYLLRDELSHSNLEVLRQNPHAHLRVIDGTGSLRTRRRAEETGAVKTGRHFAQPRLAQEA